MEGIDLQCLKTYSSLPFFRGETTYLLISYNALLPIAQGFVQQKTQRFCVTMLFKQDPITAVIATILFLSINFLFQHPNPNHGVLSYYECDSYLPSSVMISDRYRTRLSAR